MGIRKIVTLGDESLRKHCKPQEKFDRRLATLLKDMAETMYKAEGVGLAAPQVGILRRAAVVDVTEDHSGLLEMMNPEIIEREGELSERTGTAGRRDPADEDQGPVPGPERRHLRTGNGRL